MPADRYVEVAFLRGDASDGLPGVRGVGEKTARALIQSYGSLDEIVAEPLTKTARQESCERARQPDHCVLALAGPISRLARA